MIKMEGSGIYRLGMSWGYMPGISETLRTEESGERKASFNQFNHGEVCINRRRAGVSLWILITHLFTFAPSPALLSSSRDKVTV